MSLIGDRFDCDPKAAQNALGQVLGMMFLGGASATVIGGTLAYVGSWRLVYLVYGIAELIIAFLMLKILEKQPGTAAGLNLKDAYRDAFANSDLLKTVSIIFLVGSSVFGSFTYAGKLVQTRTGYNILLVGLILTFFGLATVVGGRKTGALRQKLGNKLLFFAGILGCASWVLMGFWSSPVLLSLSLAGFGLGFIMIQTTLIVTAQQLMPARRGTVMSLASFNMFVGGGIGTFVNGKILLNWGFGAIFVFAAALILLAGAIAAALLQKIAPVASPRLQPEAAQAQNSLEVDQ